MSQICCLEPRHYIAKARTKVRVSHVYGKIDRLSRTMKNAVHVDLVNGIGTFKKNISHKQLLNAWESKDYGGVMREIPWNNIDGAFSGARNRIKQSMGESIAISRTALSAPVNHALRLDVSNPMITNYIDDHVGRLIQNVTEESRNAVSSAVRRSFTHALTPRDVAKEVKDSVRMIGLNKVQQGALSKYREGLESKGTLSPNRIDDLVHSYSERLLDQRCMTIARSEVRQSNNYAQLSTWKEAADQGLIERGRARKVWIVDGNPCEICEPMDGISVPIDGLWDLNDGDSVDIPNEAHPNCYCGMEFEYSDKNDEGDEE